MFNISDHELDGLEQKATASDDRQPFRPRPFGDEGGFAPPMPTAEPLPAEPPPTAALVPVAPPSEGAAAGGAGRALALVTVGLVAGAIVGGPWGAASGVAFMGAARNLVRVKSLWASPVDEDRSEAGKSATLGIFGLGIAAALGYQAYKQRTTQGGSPFHDDD